MSDDEAVYLADDFTWSGQLYELSGYQGFQCPGLLGDFLYLGARVRLSPLMVASKLLWYAVQPITAERTRPPCGWCKDHAGGMHAIDQFALALAVGHATQGKCTPLNMTTHRHNPENKPVRSPEVEIVHDKIVRIATTTATTTARRRTTTTMTTTTTTLTVL